MAEDIWTVEYDNHGNGSFHEWFDIGPVRVEVSKGYGVKIEDAERLANAIADLMNRDFPDFGA
jgi:hypothetical protein